MVEEAKKTIIETEGSVQRLIIVSADIDDQGKYKCVAENIGGKAETQATLTVQGIIYITAPLFFFLSADRLQQQQQHSWTPWRKPGNG